MERFEVDTVAVIGAGPCGLSAAKYLLAEKKFSRVHVFEQKDTVGGTWSYDPLPKREISWVDEKDGSGVLISPIYDFLETNIPNTLMNYSDQRFPAEASLFPKHQVVKKYLDDYANPIMSSINLSTQVRSVKKILREDRPRWEVEALDLKTQKTTTAYFDAVLVANGHYNSLFVPEIKGLDTFREAYPGVISHAKYYRNPEQFRAKKVIIVGNSASGIDISAQVSTRSKLPVLVSEKTRPDPFTGEKPAAWAKMVPEIDEFLVEGRSVRLSNGDVERDVDAVIFCTGYLYTYPFLGEVADMVVSESGHSMRNLYHHLFYTNDPTLAFTGIPQRVVPFPVSEGQASWVARVWAGRLSLPTEEEMREWERRMLEDLPKGKSPHDLAFPKDAAYINMMNHLSSVVADRRAGLENDGVGKIPPFWDEEKQWLRERMPLIKAASRKLGDERHKVKTLKQLGFECPSVAPSTQVE